MKLNDIKEIDSADEYIQLGKNLLSAEQYENAVDYFIKAQNCNPMNIEIYKSLGLAYANLEKYKESEDAYQMAIKLNKDDPMLYFNMGNISILQNKINQGVGFYNTAVSKGCMDGELFYNLGLIYESLQDFNMAFRNYSKAIKINHLSPEYRLSKILLYIKLQRYDEALQTIEEMIQFCPEIYEGYHLTIGIYCLIGKFDEAKKVLTAAIERFPGDVSLIYDKIRIMVSEEQYDEALCLIEDTEKMDGYEYEERNLIFEKAKIYAVKEMSEETIETLENLKTYETSEGMDYEARYFLINAYMSIADYENALKNAEDILNGPEVSDSSYYISAIYYQPFCMCKLGRLEEGNALYQEALRYLRSLTILSPNNFEVYLFRILCHKELKDYEKSLELVDYVLLLDKNNASLHSIKADLLKKLGKLKEADEEMILARSLDADLINMIEQEEVS